MERVAVIGTGIQGTAIVERLASAGVEVSVHDRVEAQTLRCQALGARVCGSIAAAIEASDVVMLVLPAGDAPLHALAAPETLRALRERHLVLQLGSTAVEAAHRMAALVTSTGAAFAECVLAGPIAALLDASCELLFGGDAGAMARSAPLVSRFGRLRHTGGVGSASAFNLAALAQVYATLHGFYLACGLVDRSGLDASQYLDFVKNGVAGHPGQLLCDFVFPAHIDRRAYPLIGPVQVRNDCSLEETKLLARRVRELHLHPGLIDALASTHAAAAERDAGADWTSVYDELVKPRPAVGGRADEAREDAAEAYEAAHEAAKKLRDAGLSSLASGGEGEGRLRVRDGMNPRVSRVTEDATLGDVAELMAVTQASDIAVVDRARRFIGVVSEGDVIRALLPDFDEVVHARGSIDDAGELFLHTASKARSQPITRLIIRNPLTLRPDDDLLRAAIIMVEKMIRRLPVVEDGRFLGTLSRGDLCWALTSAEGAR